MTKQQALKILIEHSYLLTEEAKQQLYHRIPQLSEEEVDVLGKLLAEEKKQSLEMIDQKISNLEDVIQKLRDYQKTAKN